MNELAEPLGLLRLGLHDEDRGAHGKRGDCAKTALVTMGIIPARRDDFALIMRIRRWVRRGQSI
jgi:hypothetical protein